MLNHYHNHQDWKQREAIRAARQQAAVDRSLSYHLLASEDAGATLELVAMIADEDNQ